MTRASSRATLSLAFSFLLFGSVGYSQSQSSEMELERMGLTLHWQAQISQSAKTDAIPSLTLWPHSTLRQQYVTVLFNGRSEHFSSEQVDRDKYEKASAPVIVEKNGKKVLKSDSISVPRLGMEGARKQAELTESRLEIIARKGHRPEDGTLVVLVGKSNNVEALDARTKKVLWTKPQTEIQFGIGRSRTITVDGKKYRVIAERIEVDRPNIYLVSGSPDGVIQSFDAETGDALWSTEIGDSRLPTLTPGVSDNLVAVVNGQELFLLNTQDGRVVNQRHCDRPGVGGALPVGEWAFLPGLDGHMIGYNTYSSLLLPWTVRSKGHTKELPTLSLNGKFIAWNCEPSFLFIVKVDERIPRLWSRFESVDPLASAAAPCNAGFVVAGAGGTISCIGIPSAEKVGLRGGNSLIWKFTTGKGILQSPSVGYGLVVAVTSSGEMLALNEKDGTIAWDVSTTGIKEIVTITKNAVYARTIDNRLVSVDPTSGAIRGKTSFTVPEAFQNNVNDRLYFVGERGNILCLRETQALTPVSIFGSQASSTEKKKEAKPATESAEGDDLFNGTSGMEGDSGTTEFGAEGDPFGGTDGADADSKDAAADDPFGSDGN